MLHYNRTWILNSLLFDLRTTNSHTVFWHMENPYDFPVSIFFTSSPHHSLLSAQKRRGERRKHIMICLGSVMSSRPSLLCWGSHLHRKDVKWNNGWEVAHAHHPRCCPITKHSRFLSFSWNTSDYRVITKWTPCCWKLMKAQKYKNIKGWGKKS